MQRPMKRRSFQHAVIASCAAFLSIASATPAAAQQAAGGVSSTPASRQLPNATLGFPMTYRSTADQVSFMLGGLRVPVTMPSVDGQATVAPSTSLRGPRLQPQLRGVEPSIVQPNALARPAGLAHKNTIVVSTLALVLVAVIVTILIVK
jgi:hypothetical protein